MNTFQYFILCILSILLLSTTCIRKSPIIVDNRLDKNIYVITSFEYPDTTLSHIDKNNLSLLLINSFSKETLGHMRYYTLEGYGLSERRMKSNDVILFFVLDKDSVNAGDWNEYSSGNKYLKRYKFSYNDIIRNGCKIIIE